jgi:hypothetical protein
VWLVSPGRADANSLLLSCVLQPMTPTAHWPGRDVTILSINISAEGLGPVLGSSTHQPYAHHWGPQRVMVASQAVMPLYPATVFSSLQGSRCNDLAQEMHTQAASSRRGSKELPIAPAAASAGRRQTVAVFLCCCTRVLDRAPMRRLVCAPAVWLQVSCAMSSS